MINNTISAESPHEKQKSESLQVVRMESKQFRGEINPMKKMEHFVTFLSAFSNFLANETDRYTLSYYIEKYCHYISDFSQKVEANTPVFYQTLKVVTNAYSIFPTPAHSQSYSSFILNIINTFDLFPNSTKTAEEYVRVLFSEEEFFKQFCIFNGLELIFEQVFTKHDSKLLNSFAIDCCIDCIKDDFIHYINYENFLVTVIEISCAHAVPSQNILDSIRFIAKLLRRASLIIHDWIRYFLSHDGLVTIDLFLTHCGIEERCAAYKELINCTNPDETPPPNVKVLAHVKLLFDAQVENQPYFFKVLIHTIRKYRNCTRKINNETPITSWITMKTPDIDLYMELMRVINKRSPEEVKSILPFLFKTLFKTSSSTQSCLKVLDLFASQMEKGFLSVSSLIEIGFLAVFVFNSPHETIYDLLNKSASFKTILISIFSNEETISFQSSIMMIFCDIASHFPINEPLIETIAGFIINSPEKQFLEMLTNLLSDEKNSELMKSLTMAFEASTACSTSFVKNSLNWLKNECLNSRIDEDKFLEIISSLSSHIHYKSVDSLVDFLEKKKIYEYKDNKNLELAAYGKEVDRKLIKVHSLAKFLKLPENPHPYSVCVLGRYNKEAAMSPSVYNRYIDHSFIQPLLDDPLKINIIDEEDHFPFFFLEKNSGKIKIKANQFAAVTFWFKFTEMQTEESLFFSTDDIKLYIKGDTVIARSADQEFSYTINPLEWNFVVVQIEIYALKLNLNDNKTVFMLMKNSYTFNEVEIAADSSSLCLSSCIRFSNSTICEYEEIFSKGPNSIDKTKTFDCDFMVCASDFYSKDGSLEDDYGPLEHKYSNYSVEMNEKCFVIPYFGIATHFNSPDLMALLFKELEDDEENRSQIIHNIFKVCSINRSKQKLLLYRMKKVAKKITSSVKEDTLNEIIDSLLSAYKPKRIIQTIVRDKNEPLASLYKVLIQKFSFEDWKDVPFFEDKVALIAMKDPNFLPIIFSKAQQLPGVLKYVCYILRTGFTYEDKPIQREMLNHLILFSSKKKNSALIRNYLPFDTLKQLLFVSNEEIQTKVFQLMCVLNKHYKDYIQFSTSFNQVISFLCRSQEVWIHVFQLYNDNRRDSLSLLCQIVWSALLLSVYSVSYQNATSLDYLVMMKRGINCMIESIEDIIDSQECSSFILSRYPLIFNIRSLFSEKNDLDVEAYSERNVKIDEFQELEDPFWSNIVGKKPETRRTKKIKVVDQVSFYKKIVKKIITGSEDEAIDFKNLDAAALLKFVKNVGILNLFTQLILHSKGDKAKAPLAAFFFPAPLFDSNISEIVSPVLFHTLLAASTEAAGGRIPVAQILMLVGYLVGLGVTPQKPFNLFRDLLVFADALQNAHKILFREKYAHIFTTVLLNMMRGMQKNNIEVLFKVINENLKIFTDIINNSYEKEALLYVLKPYESAKSLIQLFQFEEDPKEEWLKTKHELELFQMKFTEATKKRSEDSYIYEEKSAVFLVASITKAKMKSKVLSSLLMAKLKYVHNPLLSYWSNEISDFMATNQSESKKKVLFPFSMTYQSPILLQEDPFDSEDKRIQNIYQNNVVETFPDTNLLTTLINQHGKPVVCFNVHLCRLSLDIPSVAFFYKHELAIITFAQLDVTKDNIVLIDRDPQQYNLLLKEIVLQQWGNTAIFVSSPIISIEKKNIISVFKKSSKTVAFWTWCCGHFLLTMEPSDLESAFLCLVEYNQNALNDDTQINSIECAYNEWRDGNINTESFIISSEIFKSSDFAVISNFPAFPDPLTKNCGIPNRIEISEIVEKIVKGLKSDKETDSSNCMPSIIAMIPELSKDIESRFKRMERMDSAEFKDELIHWILQVFPQLSQQIKSKPPNRHVEATLCTTNLPIIMQVYPRKFVSPFFIGSDVCEKSDRECFLNNGYKVSLGRYSIDLHKDKDLICTFEDRSLVYAVSLNSDENLVSVNLQFGIVLLLRFTPTEKTFIKVGEYYIGGIPHSLPYSAGFCTAAWHSSKLFVFNSVTSFVNFEKTFDDEIVGVSFNRNALWCITKKEAHYISVNGTEITVIKLPGEASSSAKCRNGVLVGLMNGSLCGVYGNDVHVFSKSATAPIDLITADKTGKTCITRNVNGMYAFWSAQCLGGPNIAPMHIKLCAKCKKPKHSVCKSCLRALCGKCRGCETICPLCLEYSLQQSQK